MSDSSRRDFCQSRAAEGIIYFFVAYSYSACYNISEKQGQV